MKNLKISSFILLTLFIAASCSNNSSVKPENNNTKELNSTILKDLDKADDLYINMKSADENSEELANTALKLAKAHMDKKEFILANFYIQEALSYKPYDENLKFLLVKNQYLAALNNQNDQNYLERALKAIEENQNLITDYNLMQKAQDLVNKVKRLLAKSYYNTSQTYKYAKKPDAEQFYIEKINKLGVNLETLRDNTNKNSTNYEN